MKNLRYDLIGQYSNGVYRHPQFVMRTLNIKYKHSIPQSIGDQWWFIDCEYNCKLPSYIELMKFSDEDYNYWIKDV